MEPHQLQHTAVLGDLILPGSTTAPAPSALGIPDFVDEWVSAPYPEQLEDRKTILEGLRWMDAEASRR
jgi:Gluconate 2-dehydrogenase subunit 3